MRCGHPARRCGVCKACCPWVAGGRSRHQHICAAGHLPCKAQHSQRGPAAVPAPLQRRRAVAFPAAQPPLWRAHRLHASDTESLNLPVLGKRMCMGPCAWFTLCSQPSLVMFIKSASTPDLDQHPATHIMHRVCGCMCARCHRSRQLSRRRCDIRRVCAPPRAATWQRGGVRGPAAGVP